MRLLEPFDRAEPGLVLDGILGGRTPQGLPPEVESLAAANRVATLCTGASDASKRWSTERFGRLIDGLTAAGYAVALVGGRGERASALSVLSSLKSRERVISLVGALPLQDTAAVIEASSVFVGCDSGLSHLATALGVPSVVMFGPSDPRKWSLGGERRLALHRALPCSPCAIFGYRKWCRDVPCMQSITVEEVLSAVEGLQP